MARQITFTYDGKEYIIEYDRKMFLRAEKAGFSPRMTTEQPLTQSFILFSFGLLKNQVSVNEKKASELFEYFTTEFLLDDFLTFCLEEYTNFFGQTQPDSKQEKKGLEIKES